MEKLFSISQAAKTVNMTTETLRYYDRIGLVHPSRTDTWSKYHYYSEKDIVRLHTVRTLSCMEIPLKEIKRLIELNEIEEIVSFLQNALIRADKKISELHEAKQSILRAKEFYESKIEERPKQKFYIRHIPKRTILLSNKLSQPTVDNLWNYHRHFYSQVGNTYVQSVRKTIIMTFCKHCLILPRYNIPPNRNASSALSFLQGYFNGDMKSRYFCKTTALIKIECPLYSRKYSE